MTNRQPTDYSSTCRQVDKGRLRSSVRRPTAGQNGIMARLFWG